MGKKGKKKGAAEDPAEGPPISEAQQADVVAMASRAAARSLDGAVARLDAAQAEATRLTDASRKLEHELEEAKEEMKDQYFFLQQKLDNNYDVITGLERRALTYRVDLEREEEHHKATMDLLAKEHAEAFKRALDTAEKEQAALVLKLCR